MIFLIKVIIDQVKQADVKAYSPRATIPTLVIGIAVEWVVRHQSIVHVRMP